MSDTVMTTPLAWMDAVDAGRAQVEAPPTDPEALSTAIARFYADNNLPLSPGESTAAAARCLTAAVDYVKPDVVPWARPQGLNEWANVQAEIQQDIVKSKWWNGGLLLGVLGLGLPLWFSSFSFASTMQVFIIVIPMGMVVVAAGIGCYFGEFRKRLNKRANALSAFRYTKNKMELVREWLKVPSVAECWVRLQQSEVPILVQDFIELRAFAESEISKREQIVNQRALAIQAQVTLTMHEKFGDRACA